MADLALSLAIGEYDHVRDLLDGTVRATGIELTVLRLPIEEIFYRSTFHREFDVAEMSFAKVVSLLSRQRVTDTTSGFQALNRPAIALFARDYPSDYPEVEATVLLLKHRLRLLEVPVEMRERETGSSSITFLRSLYYAIKVTLALFVGIARRSAVPTEEAPR